ncbi:unnamed protein product, partial [Adineta steineri]
MPRRSGGSGMRSFSPS